MEQRSTAWREARVVGSQRANPAPHVSPSFFDSGTRFSPEKQTKQVVLITLSMYNINESRLREWYILKTLLFGCIGLPEFRRGSVSVLFWPAPLHPGICVCWRSSPASGFAPVWIWSWPGAVRPPSLHPSHRQRKDIRRRPLHFRIQMNSHWFLKLMKNTQL